MRGFFVETEKGDVRYPSIEAFINQNPEIFKNAVSKIFETKEKYTLLLLFHHINILSLDSLAVSMASSRRKRRSCFCMGSPQALTCSASHRSEVASLALTMMAHASSTSESIVSLDHVPTHSLR